MFALIPGIVYFIRDKLKVPKHNTLEVGECGVITPNEIFRIHTIDIVYNLKCITTRFP